MYLEHFGLSVVPFTTTPDPRFYYPSAKHREALACLLYAVEQHKGFALISGEVGAGKSMLCRAAIERFGPHVDTALIVHTLLTPKQFMEAACEEFGIVTKGRSKGQLISDIRRFLIKQRELSRDVVLVVDEAQNLGPKVLEEVRLLGNLETASDKLLQILLVGQPEMRRLIASPELRQLNQRITVKFHLGTLSAADVSGYIDHRLKVAGLAENGLFDANAKAEVFEATGGVPRLVNVICDQALLEAYVRDERLVNHDTVRRVVADMEGYYMDAPAEIRSASHEVV